MIWWEVNAKIFWQSSLLHHCFFDLLPEHGGWEKRIAHMKKQAFTQICSREAFYGVSQILSHGVLSLHIIMFVSPSHCMSVNPRTAANSVWSPLEIFMYSIAAWALTHLDSGDLHWFLVWGCIIIVKEADWPVWVSMYLLPNFLTCGQSTDRCQAITARECRSKEPGFD